MKRIVIWLLLYMLTAAYAAAQADPRARYEEFKKQTRKSYEDFRAQANKRYADFLRSAWKAQEALPPIALPKNEDTPPVIFNKDEYEKKRRKPKLRDDEQEYVDDGKNGRNGKIAIRHNRKEKELIKDDDGEEIKFNGTIAPPAPAPQPTPVEPIHESPQEESVKNFIFYGTECKVRLSNKMKLALNDCSYEKLAEAWEYISSNNISNNTIRDCLELRIRLGLSDWAYLNMLDAFASQALGTTNEATFLTAYIYCQTGYKVRLAIAGNKLCILFASKHTICDLPSFSIDEEYFYPYKCKAEKVMLCEAMFPGEKPLSLFIPSTMNIASARSAPRTLTSKRYPEVSVKVQVNKNLIDFYDTYPTSVVDDNFMTRWAIYANTPIDNGVRESLYPALRKLIGGMSEKEAVERLLNWVQTAFVYEYDDKVWGHDRAFFAEESLYYPYCDCEDRSILFTRIVRDLLGLECVLIYYPGHLASAVCFNEQVIGDYILLNEKRFIVCDGTYIGAQIGMTMPGMNNKTAKVILLGTTK